MEEALRSLLLSSAPIAAIVSRRVDWGLRPQGDPYPGITLNGIGGGPIMNLAGPSGWARSRIQIDCWAQTFKQARDLGDLIAGRSGGPGLLVGMRRDVAGIRMRSIIAARRGGTDHDVKPVHRDSIDVMLWHAAL